MSCYMYEADKKALAILELPRTMALVLPGHGWRPPEFALVRITPTKQLTLMKTAAVLVV